MDIPMTKQQMEAKMRCARYLLDMIEKYGAKVLEKAKEEELEKTEAEEGKG